MNTFINPLSSFLTLIDLLDGLTHVKIRCGDFIPLTLEAIGNGPTGAPAYSFCHYGEQNGDLMRDPEVCFELRVVGQGASARRVLVPYYFRQDYMGYEAQAITEDFETESDYHTDWSEVRDIAIFAKIWSKNIRAQGFLSKAPSAVAAAKELARNEAAGV